MIKWIVIAVIGLIVLGYYGFDVRKIIDSPVVQTNLAYGKEIAVNTWHGYLEKPATYLWNELIVKYVWDPLINILNKKIKGSTSAKDSGALFLSKLQA